MPCAHPRHCVASRRQIVGVSESLRMCGRGTGGDWRVSTVCFLLLHPAAGVPVNFFSYFTPPPPPLFASPWHLLPPPVRQSLCRMPAAGINASRNPFCHKHLQSRKILSQKIVVFAREIRRFEAAPKSFIHNTLQSPPI